MPKDEVKVEKSRIDRLKAELEIFSEVKELFDLAESSGCEIVFDKNLKANEYGWIDYRERKIKLNPILDHNKLLETLSHELRHLWQACSLDFRNIYNSSLSGNGASSLAFMRITEGDANAFAAKIMAKIEGKSEDINMSKVFIDFQKTKSAQRYDNQTINYLKQIQGAITESKFTINGIRSIFNATSSPVKHDKELVGITLSYMGYENIEDLSSVVISYVPKETLEKALCLNKAIKIKAAGLLKNIT